MQQTTLMKLIDMYDLLIGETRGTIPDEHFELIKCAINNCIKIAAASLPSERKDIEEAYDIGWLNGQYSKMINKTTYFDKTFITDKTDKDGK